MINYRPITAYRLFPRRWLSSSKYHGRSHSIRQQLQLLRYQSRPGPGTRPSQWRMYNQPLQASNFKPHQTCPCTPSNHSQRDIRRPVTPLAIATVMVHLPLLTIPGLYRRVYIFVQDRLPSLRHHCNRHDHYLFGSAPTVTLNTTVAIGVADIRHIPTSDHDGDSRPDSILFRLYVDLV